MFNTELNKWEMQFPYAPDSGSRGPGLSSGQGRLCSLVPSCIHGYYNVLLGATASAISISIK